MKLDGSKFENEASFLLLYPSLIKSFKLIEFTSYLTLIKGFRSKLQNLVLSFSLKHIAFKLFLLSCNICAFSQAVNWQWTYDYSFWAVTSFVITISEIWGKLFYFLLPIVCQKTEPRLFDPLKEASLLMSKGKGKSRMLLFILDNPISYLSCSP